MAWNQPGQNNPWGRRPGQGGGPDLDERVKSWQRRLGSLFRPGGGRSEVSEMATREVVGRSELDNLLVGKTRPEITRRAKDLIQRTLDAYNTGITITTVNLTDVQVPEAVIPSQRDANKALADQERFVKESQAYSNTIIPVAQGGAARMQQYQAACKTRGAGMAEGQTARYPQ